MGAGSGAGEPAEGVVEAGKPAEGVEGAEGVAELPLLKLLRIEYFEPKYDFSIFI